MAFRAFRYEEEKFKCYSNKKKTKLCQNNGVQIRERIEKEICIEKKLMNVKEINHWCERYALRVKKKKSTKQMKK